MTRFEATLERLRALPDDEKDAIAARIDLMLDDGFDDLLSPEEWAEIEREALAPALADLNAGRVNDRTILDIMKDDTDGVP